MSFLLYGKENWVGQIFDYQWQYWVQNMSCEIPGAILLSQHPITLMPPTLFLQDLARRIHTGKPRHVLPSRKEGVQRMPKLSYTVHPMGPWEHSLLKEERKTPYICFPVTQNRTYKTSQLSPLQHHLSQNNKNNAKWECGGKTPISILVSGISDKKRRMAKVRVRASATPRDARYTAVLSL